MFVPLCKKCFSSFSNIALSEGDFRCEKCGRPLTSEIKICSFCRNGTVVKSVDKVFALQTYRLWKKNLLFSWKMFDKRILSPFFAQIIEKKIKQIEKSFGKKLFVVPVPPRPNKKITKGWDQIEDLCFYMKKGFGREILPILKRNTTVQQKKLGRLERFQTIGKAYSINEKFFEKKKNSSFKIPNSVVIIDDIITTGSTLEDCASVLKKIGVLNVYTITLFAVT